MNTTTRHLALGLALVACLSTVAPANAVDVPAYGSITISNPGTGFTVSWTYDPQFWTCGTEVGGPFNAPTSVLVRCARRGDDQTVRFVCPLMVLTVHTGGLAARAGGRATCTSSLDTGVISGVNSAQRSGNLGAAREIRCLAYTDFVALTPPYTVTCSEPGMPTP